MANDDRVYLAYSGELGEEFQKSTQKRVDWIVAQADGARDILDIGCSQGIVSLVLGEKADTVLGIDIQPEAIEFAENLKHTQYPHLAEKVTFQCVDFMNYETDRKYDCIMITEVLEHLQKPAEFVAKAATLLKESGKLVVSVPFGVNDHPDHYATFYLSDFYDLLSGYLKVGEVFFMERWIGAIAYPMHASVEAYQLDEASIKHLEQNFLLIDRKMTDRVASLYEKLQAANAKYKTAGENYAKSREILENRIEQVNDKYRGITASYARYKEEVKAEMLKEVKDYEKSIQVMEELNRKIQKLEAQNSTLMNQNYENRKKLDMIEKNPIGKLGIKVYKQYKKIRHR